MKWQLSRTTLWIALIASILVAGLTSQSTVFAKDPTADQIQAGMLATVKIWILGPDGKAIGTCSGTVIDPVGYILTNFHCVGHTDLYGPDDTDLNLEDGDLYNPNGVSVIGPTLDPKQAPKPTYLAQFVTGNTQLDIAVVKIVALYDSKDPLPKQLPSWSSSAPARTMSGWAISSRRLAILVSVVHSSVIFPVKCPGLMTRMAMATLTRSKPAPTLRRETAVGWE